jgi:hypothetical protein
VRNITPPPRRKRLFQGGVMTALIPITLAIVFAAEIWWLIR